MTSRGLDVGYLGTGSSGAARMKRIAAGRPVHVWAADPDASALLTADGVNRVQDPREVVRRCQVVFISRSDPAEIRASLFGPEGLSSSLTRGSILVDQSRGGDPRQTRATAAELAEIDVALVDAPAPVPGGAPGTVSSLSGPEEATRAVAQILVDSGESPQRSGEVGDAQYAALLDHAMAICCRLATLELIAMGRKFGLDVATMTEVINKGSGRNATTRFVLPALLAGEPPTGDALTDALLALELSNQIGVASGAPMLIGGVTQSMLQAAANQQADSATTAGLIGMIESMANVTMFPGTERIGTPARAGMAPEGV